MTLLDMQHFVMVLAKSKNLPAIPVHISRRIQRCLGIAHFSFTDVNFHQKIELRADCCGWSDAYAKSVLIHEFCHVWLRLQHTKKFFAESKKLHTELSLYEARVNKTYHGKVFQIAADHETLIPQSRYSIDNKDN
jgi:hypothetical protein